MIFFLAEAGYLGRGQFKSGIYLVMIFNAVFPPSFFPSGGHVTKSVSGLSTGFYL